MTEKTYRDRQGKAEALKDITAGLAPAFAPADTTLTATNFGTFIATVHTKNTLVEGLTDTYRTNAITRVALVKTIKKTATQALARLKSNKLWVSEHASAKKLADKLRGARTGNTKPPVEGEPPVDVKDRNRGEQGYVEVAAMYDRFIIMTTGAAGYATGVPTEISLATMNALLTSLKSVNILLSTTGGTLSTEQEKRKRLYFEAGGLAEKFQSVKEAVKSQYGQTSAEYLSARGVKW